MVEMIYHDVTCVRSRLGCFQPGIFIALKKLGSSRSYWSTELTGAVFGYVGSHIGG